MHPKMQVALIELLRAYETGEGLVMCSLCMAAGEIAAETKTKNSCLHCQWVIEGYEPFGNYCACAWWLEQQGEDCPISLIRKSPQDYPELTQKRIDMIKHWLLNDK